MTQALSGALLEAAQNALTPLFRLNDQNGNHCGPVSPSSVKREAEQLKINHFMRDGVFSNHQALTHDNLVTKYEAALTDVFAALEGDFPGHDLTYRLEPYNKKHELWIDGQSMVTATLNSFLGQIPLLKRILGAAGRGKPWIIDQGRAGQRHQYRGNEVVYAPDLANALLRASYAKMTQAQRKSAVLTLIPAHAAVRIDKQAGPAAPVISIAPVNARAIEKSWDALLQELEGSWPSPSSPEFEVRVSPEETPLFSEKDLAHIMLSDEDRDQVTAATKKTRQALNGFIARIADLAPGAAYTLRLRRHGPQGRGIQLQMDLGNETCVDGLAAARSLAICVERNAMPEKLFAVPDNATSIWLMRARDTTQALRGVEYAAGTAWPATPASLASLAAAKDQAQKLWEARRHALPFSKAG